jgi:hypothetical protein
MTGSQTASFESANGSELSKDVHPADKNARVNRISIRKIVLFMHYTGYTRIKEWWLLQKT